MVRAIVYRPVDAHSSTDVSQNSPIRYSRPWKTGFNVERLRLREVLSQVRAGSGACASAAVPLPSAGPSNTSSGACTRRICVQSTMAAKQAAAFGMRMRMLATPAAAGLKSEHMYITSISASRAMHNEN